MQSSFVNDLKFNEIKPINVLLKTEVLTSSESLISLLITPDL